MLAIMIKSYFMLNIFQQAYYGFDLYFKWIKKHFWTINSLLPVLLLVNFYPNVITYSILILFSLLFFAFYYKHEKKHLKFTKRVLRISLFMLIFSVLLSFIFPLFVVYLIVDLLLVLAVFCLKPIEFLINKSYIKKAIKKISLSKAKRIAITGSFAKTSVKNFCAHILSEKYLVKATPKSYNTPLGITKFINDNDFEMTDFVIYEFGARHTNDIKELRDLYKYDVAIVTEVGLMHLDTFGSLTNILKSKMDILNGLDEKGIAILNYENELIRNYPCDKRVIGYGFNFGNYCAKNIKLDLKESSFDLYVDEKHKGRYKTKLVGRHNILNLLPAFILCDLYDINYRVIEKISSVDNRLLYKKVNNFNLLMDAYNSNLVGASNALEIVKKHPSKRYIITPGFVECDKEKAFLVKELVKLINESVDFCFLIDNDFTIQMINDLHVSYQLFKTFKEAYKFFLENHEDNAILLVENDWLDVY